MVSLPVEIINDEILPKLPPKSLLRFKSVSKQFNSLISSPNFTTLHLINSLSSDANRFLIVNHGGPNLVDLENPKLPPSRIPIPASFRPHPYKPIAGSCNGLLLLRCMYRNDYLLINPCTGLYLLLVLPRTLFVFGYDPYTDDYKIVMIDTGCSMLVYSVSNGIWRSVFSNNNSKEQKNIMDRIASCDPVVFNGHLFHWLVWCPEIKKHRIVCFDVCIENWTVDVPVPNYEDSSSDSGRRYAELLVKYGKDKRNDLAKLGVFEGCLCVLAESTDCTVHDGMDVWVMKEYGVLGSWVKLFSVPHRHHAPLAYVRGSSSKVLLLEDHKKERRRLISYDIQSEKSKKADIHDKHKVRNFNQGCMFKGSLVDLPKKEFRRIRTRYS